MRNTESSELKEVYKQLKEFFNNIQAWKSDSSSEFSFEKLMKSEYFENKDEEIENMIDWSKLTVFGLYTCKQSSDKATYRKAKHIAKMCSSG